MAAWDDWARRNGGIEPEYGENGYDPRYEEGAGDGFSNIEPQRPRGSRSAARLTRKSRVPIPDDNRAARTKSSYGRENYERRGDATAPGKKRRGGKLRIAGIALAVVLAAGAGLALAANWYLNGNLHGYLGGSLDNVLVKTDMAKKPFYVLLMGTDESAERDNDEYFGGTFRTDSIMLARIDPVNKKVAMVSIHRDTLVDLGEHGQQKLNAAHAFGGPALSVKTVSKMAGVDINHYAEINFDGFKEIVDALGGIEVEVPVEINDSDAGGHLDAGLQTLSGDQALILCRSRNTYGDYADPDSMRAANQRLVLSAIAKKMLSSDPATIASTVSALSKHVTTDLNVTDIIGLAQTMRGLDPQTDIYTAMEPVTSKYVDGGWYTYTNEAEWKAMIARMNNGEPPSSEAIVDETSGTVIATTGEELTAAQKSASVSVRNGCGVAGLGDKAATKLKEAGFTNVSTGNAESFDYGKTVIVYNSATNKYEAEQIAGALGAGTAMMNDGNYILSSDFLVVLGSDWAALSDAESSGKAS